jgi:hypothetical protein
MPGRLAASANQSLRVGNHLPQFVLLVGLHLRRERLELRVVALLQHHVHHPDAHLMVHRHQRCEILVDVSCHRHRRRLVPFHDPAQRHGAGLVCCHRFGRGWFLRWCERRGPQQDHRRQRERETNCEGIAFHGGAPREDAAIARRGPSTDGEQGRAGSVPWAVDCRSARAAAPSALHCRTRQRPQCDPPVRCKDQPAAASSRSSSARS